MTPMDKVFMLDIEARLDINTLTSIMEDGHSRVPVFEGDRNNIVSCLHMKDLALVNPEEGIPLRSFLSFYGRPIPKIRADKTLDHVLNEFKSGKSHIAIVQRFNGADNTAETNVGIATLEDVLEEILQEEIMDEDDVEGTKGLSGFREIVLKGGSSQVNQQQLKAIYTYLSSTLTEFSPSIMSEDAFKYLMNKAEIKQIEKPTQLDEILYERGTPSSYFTLILQGKIEIQSGAEGFRSDGGPFTYLGLAALKNETFTPDFTAKVLLNTQMLRIKKKQYDDALRMHHSFGQPVAQKKTTARQEPKSFMDNIDFESSRRAASGRRTPINIAMKEFNPIGKKKEEKIGLMDDTDDLNGPSGASSSPPSIKLASSPPLSIAIDGINGALV